MAYRSLSNVLYLEIFALKNTCCNFILIPSCLLITLFVEICSPLTLGNGMVICGFGDNGGPNAGDECTLTCDRGTIMDGSDMRTCIENGTWSGDETTCTARMYVCIVQCIL